MLRFFQKYFLSKTSNEFLMNCLVLLPPVVKTDTLCKQGWKFKTVSVCFRCQFLQIDKIKVLSCSLLHWALMLDKMAVVLELTVVDPRCSHIQWYQGSILNQKLFLLEEERSAISNLSLNDLNSWAPRSLPNHYLYEEELLQIQSFYCNHHHL